MVVDPIRPYHKPVHISGKLKPCAEVSVHEATMNRVLLSALEDNPDVVALVIGKEQLSQLIEGLKVVAAFNGSADKLLADLNQLYTTVYGE